MNAELERKLLYRYDFDKTENGLVYEMAKNKVVVSEEGKFQVYGSESFKEYASQVMINMGFIPIPPDEKVEEEEVKAKLLQDEFVDGGDIGFYKAFKTHIVSYKDGEVIFFFKQRKDVGNNDERISRWAERFRKLGIVPTGYKLMVEGE